ncbi:MAG: polyprenyl synthetase family protein [Rikenellaceae bacterium]|jgi:geranylgeranyl diphosphate synthase type II|nr:polyprenyl synthetase family protein [Rikenellaceae bacterium]
MYGQQDISRLVDEYMANLPIPCAPQGIYVPMAYTLAEGGKRLRPTLVCAACNIFSDNILQALPPAAAVEVFHNFTLIHDDIMDNATLRRGRETVFRRWGANTAILSGDATLIFAYMLLGNTPREHLAAALAQFNLLALEVCEGQQYDVDFERADSVSTDDYFHMISLKTAALMARALRIGAIVGGAGEADCDALQDFGLNLGLAFQLQDDLLDAYGDAATFGKSIGGDILERKKSYLMICALAQGFSTEIETILSNGALSDEAKIAQVKQIYDRAGAAAAAREAIEHYTSLALKALEPLSVAPERCDVLRAITLELLNRNK